MSYMIKIQYQMNNELITQMILNLEQNQQFKLIVQNLQESLVISSDEKIELVNEQFLK